MLSIAISVLFKKDDNNENLLLNQIKNFIKFIPPKKKNCVEIIYIIQCNNLKKFQKLKSRLSTFTEKLESNIRFIYGGKKGVAFSRNIAIREANTKYLLFFDLDCKFKYDIEDFLNFLEKKNEKYIYFSNINDYKSKNGSFLPRINKIPFLPKSIYKYLFCAIAITKSPTYNIIISPSYCRENKIFFDTKLGLGSFYKQSDEALFLINLFKSLIKNNFKTDNLYFANNLYSDSLSHQNISELRYSLQSKGYVIRKGFNIIIGLVIIFPTLIIFCLKYKNFINPFKSAYYVLKGFLKPQ